MEALHFDFDFLMCPLFISNENVENMNFNRKYQVEIDNMLELKKSQKLSHLYISFSEKSRFLKYYQHFDFLGQLLQISSLNFIVLNLTSVYLKVSRWFDVFTNMLFITNWRSYFIKSLNLSEENEMLLLAHAMSLEDENGAQLFGNEDELSYARARDGNIKVTQDTPAAATEKSIKKEIGGLLSARSIDDSDNEQVDEQKNDTVSANSNGINQDKKKNEHKMIDFDIELDDECLSIDEAKCSEKEKLTILIMTPTGEEIHDSLNPIIRKALQVIFCCDLYKKYRIGRDVEFVVEQQDNGEKLWYDRVVSNVGLNDRYFTKIWRLLHS